MTTSDSFPPPEPRPSRIRSPIRIFAVVVVSLMLVPTMLALLLGGISALLLDEGIAAAVRSLVPAALIIGGYVLLVRWAFRWLPVNPDGSVGGKIVRVQHRDLIRQEEFRLPEPGGAAAEAPAARRLAIRWQPGAPIPPDRETWSAGTTLAAAIVWLVAGGGMIGLAAFMALSAGSSPEPGFYAAAVALVVVPGIALLVLSRLIALRTRDWRACRIELPDGPGRPGEAFTVRAILPHAPARIGRVEATLVHRTQRPHIGRRRPVTFAENWRQDIGAHPRADVAGSMAELRFELPTDAPVSSLTRGSHASLWQLELKAGPVASQAPGLRGGARFTVPVAAVQPQ